MNNSEKNKPVVFITGASAGIGAAAVEVFAAAGYNVVLAARRQELLAKLAAATSAKHPASQCIPCACDVASDASVRAAFDMVQERFGKLDALINNAGFGVYGSVAATPIAVYRQNMETNYFGVIRCTQAALPLLRAAALRSSARWGAGIVMVSSFVGRRALPMMGSYSATKFALEGMSEALRVELHDERISVSVVNPGLTDTDFGQAAQGTRPANYLQPARGMPPEAVAAKLLQAVRHPRRNRYLTAAGQAGLAVQWLAPSLVDYLLLPAWRKAAKSETFTPPPPFQGGEKNSFPPLEKGG